MVHQKMGHFPEYLENAKDNYMIFAYVKVVYTKHVYNV